MRKNIKRVFLTSVLLCSWLFLVFPSANSVLAQGNPPPDAAAQLADAKAKAEAEAKAKADAEAKAKATENQGDVAEPPSGPDVNRETVIEEVEVNTPASVTGQKVEGTGTVTDFSTTGSKAFYTITDSEQNIFHLIIDLEKTSNNVYFLSDVKKSELEGGGQPQEVVTTVPPVQEVESATEVPKESGNGFLIIVLLLAVVGVAAYYFLVMKKKQGKNNANDEDEMSEDYEEDVYEDEKDNKDIK